jgi:hypothetical protein
LISNGKTPGKLVYSMPADLHLVGRLSFKGKRDLRRYLKSEEAQLRALEAQLEGSPLARHCVAALWRVHAAQRALKAGDHDAALVHARELPHIEAALFAEPERMRGAKMAQDAAKGSRARAQKNRNEKLAAWRARATDLWKEDRSRSRTRVADIIHRELRDSKSPRQAKVRTIRAAIADLHPYKGKLAK